MVRDRPGAEERPAGSGTLLILLCSTGRDRACRRALGAPEPRARRPQSSRVGSSPTPCDGRSSPSTGIGTVGCSPPANHPTLLRRPHLLRRRRLRRRSTACSTSPYNPLAESRTRRADRNRSATVLSVYVDARPGRNIRFPKELAGLHPGGPNRLDVPLLDDVAEAAKRYRRADQERQEAREALREKIRIARDRGSASRPSPGLLRSAASTRAGSMPSETSGSQALPVLTRDSSPMSKAQYRATIPFSHGC
jgi:hypothetical protein